MKVESGTEFASSSHIAKRYERRELRSSSTRINSHVHDFHQTQDIDQKRLVDVVFGRWYVDGGDSVVTRVHVIVNSIPHELKRSSRELVAKRSVLGNH